MLSLCTSYLCLPAMGENKLQEKQSSDSKMPQVQEAADIYIVVFKEEATAQESKKNYIDLQHSVWLYEFIDCFYMHAVDLHKNDVNLMMSNVGPILNEYNIGNKFRGYSAKMSKG